MVNRLLVACGSYAVILLKKIEFFPGLGPAPECISVHEVRVIWIQLISFYPIFAKCSGRKTISMFPFHLLETGKFCKCKEMEMTNWVVKSAELGSASS